MKKILLNFWYQLKLTFSPAYNDRYNEACQILHTSQKYGVSYELEDFDSPQDLINWAEMGQ